MEKSWTFKEVLLKKKLCKNIFKTWRKKKAGGGFKVGEEQKTSHVVQRSKIKFIAVSKNFH